MILQKLKTKSDYSTALQTVKILMHAGAPSEIISRCLDWIDREIRNNPAIASEVPWYQTDEYDIMLPNVGRKKV
jgi:hypothetical protein